MGKFRFRMLDDKHVCACVGSSAQESDDGANLLGELC